MGNLLDNIDKKASVINAREMIIFSYPKVGKTELMTKLPGDYLILDSEGGTDFYDSKAIDIREIEVFDKLMKELKSSNKKFDYIVIDTLTSLIEGVVNSICVRRFNKEEGKDKPLNWDITQLAYGAGHGMIRDVIKKIIDSLKKYCKTLIICAHVVDKSLTGKDEVSSVKDIDVPGKLKNILSLKTDAIGLLHRSAEYENTLTFIAASGMIGGARIKHLSNKAFVISEKKGDELVTYWDKIFIKSKK